LRILGRLKGKINGESLMSGLGLAVVVITLISFFAAKTGVTVGLIDYSENISLFEYVCFIVFCVPFYFYVTSFTKRRRESIKSTTYAKKLNSVIITQSHNELFYTGNVFTGSAILVKEVVDSIGADRASIWLYNDDESSIICQQLYIEEDSSFHQDMELRREDCPEYFEAMQRDPMIVANDARSHHATRCFLKTYLIPLGIRSMLDVPIWYRGRVIGVICIESLAKREWKKEEIDFAQILSSLYAFAYSVKEGNEKQKSIEEFERFVNKATLVSMTDARGKITYVNDKFSKVSGWSEEEVIGQDHAIVNSDEQPPGYWGEMYRTVLNGDIWNDIVTNRAKDGSLYYVDTYIKASFDHYGKLKGFMSIRQDVTEIVTSGKIVEKKNTYLEHAAKILRHDMHSGINTYIPRGISSLERRLTDEQIKELKLEAPLKMIKEGLRHTQKVYRGVYEFTNLVKKDVILNREECNLKEILDDYLASTAYSSQVIISDLGIEYVNDALFCTAVDNLIRNGLKYNDSPTKWVKIYREGDILIIEDNGRGMSAEDFKKLSQPYVRKEGQKETGTGLGLNICVAILEEHRFNISCDALPVGGTQIKITLS
jgi:PAS domain S-box-containing protein